ncbi:hypothetical protein ONZ51_g1801 [Trametes cubensis]|uniref:Xylanolytic transcriptional activator regulatory domain-containing protein n=1 Tax=Trametes cubensis TaxID=1111947 RepID=A0AAD7U0R4_9APHY|nr:hypothetical protein ONZ51_g1801 [Trametes cubensis]
MSSPPDPQPSLLRSHNTSTTKLSPQSLPFSAPPDHIRHPDNDHVSVAFVKGGKRKRLSKVRLPAHFTPHWSQPTTGRLVMLVIRANVAATGQVSSLLFCPYEHRNIFRTSVTAPCSNCYYASKNCTYTDAAGRPVPAPRNANPERPVTAAIATVSPTSEPPPWAGQATAAGPPGGPQNGIERDPTTKRSRRGQPGGSTSPSAAPKVDGLTDGHASTLLDPATTHELVNIFFAHCNPQRMILHKPSFSSALSLNQVPLYLVLAVCALAAPLCKSVASKAQHARLAGVPYFQEALNLMFDNSGRLLCEPSVSTAQALCLLEMHEVAASHSWTRHYRYFELALQVLEGSLEVHRSDNAAPPSPTDSDALMEFIDRECTRRCFWLIQIMAWISNIYTRKPIRPRMAELADLVRLPIDETTFELAVLSSSATSEYLRRPAPRTRYASQLGHMCRILEIQHNVETILATKDGPERVAAISAVRPELQAWVDSLPSHLQFTDENLETQVAMFETSSNSGAWCYCFMHAMYPCCYLAILESYSKYNPDDPQVQVWDRDFEKVWGFKVVLVAEQWRQSQAMQRKSAMAAQQQQQQQQQQHQQQAMYQPRDTHSKSASGSPTSTHSSPETQPYEGRSQGGNPRALLRSHASMSDLDAAASMYASPPNSQSQLQTNLPSLKASGLLDSWRPPSEAFANALSLASPPQPPPQQTTLQSPPMQQTLSNGSGGRVGLEWLVDSGPRQLL